MRENFSDIEIGKMLVLANKYNVTSGRIVNILNDIYQANFDEDLETVEEHLIEVEGV